MRNLDNHMCPKCDREYQRDFVIGVLSETTRSKRKTRPPCSYCQESYESYRQKESKAS